MDTVEDLWMKLDKTLANSENLNETVESTLIIVGEPFCGKSSLIQAYLRPTISKEPKSTAALEYNFARKKNTSSLSSITSTSSNQTTSSLCHIWELGGDINEARLLEIPLTRLTVASTSVMVCCDLSKPQNVLATLQKWTKAIRELVKKLMNESKLSNNSLKSANNGTKSNYNHNLVSLAYQDHPKDASRARPCEIPLFFVLNKYDLFKILPINDKRAAYQAVRMFAHYHGATILTTSTVETALKDSFRIQMNSLCFPVDAASSLKSTSSSTGHKTSYETNVDKAIQITAGRDDFETVLLMSLISTSNSSMNKGGNINNNIEVNSGNNTVAKSRLLTAESDVMNFVTVQGLTQDCWTKFNEHMKKLFGTSEVEPLKAYSNEDMISSGTNAATAENNNKNIENEFPETAVDEMKVQMELALARYVQEAERKEIIRIKMNESDTATTGITSTRNANVSSDIDKTYDNNSNSNTQQHSKFASKAKKPSSHK